jgi:arylsulfatase A-like enzyme
MVAPRALVTVLVLTLACACSRQSPRGVILISLDTLRADRLGCYGYTRDTSPFLDSLAARGTLFEHAVVQVPGTLPSHMSMFTGLYPAEHNVAPPDGVLAPIIPTLPEALREAGFRTAGFTEGGYVSGRFGFARGFEQFDDSASKLCNDMETTFARGLEFLRSTGDTDRFFLFLHTYAVHDPYYPPVPYGALFWPSDVPTDREELGLANPDLGPTQLTEAQKKAHRATVRWIKAAGPEDAFLPTGPNLAGYNRGRSGPLSEATRAYFDALYDAGIRYSDNVLRVFFERLRASGFADDTIVVITSDHGEEFLEHGRLVHEQVYHECLHVPLIVLYPGHNAGRRVGQLVRSVDLAPTLLELLGAPPLARASGRSFAGAILGRGMDPPPHSYAQAVVEDNEAIYRFVGNSLYHLVSRRPAPRGQDAWFGSTAVLESMNDHLELEAMSFPHARSVTVTCDGVALDSLQFVTDWRHISLELPAGDGKHVIELSSPGCASPKELGLSDDPRCLAFALRNVDLTTTELFDVIADPREAADISAAQLPITRELLETLATIDLQPVAESQSETLDAETEEQLRALGYLE